MAQGFNVGLRCQQEWSWLLAIWLFMGGSGSGLFLVYVIFDLPLFFALLSLASVLSGGLILLVELGNPLRVWRAVSRPNTSWLSRGILFVVGFIVFGSLSIAPELAAFSWLPWGGGGLAATVLTLIAGLCALMVTLYPGFFFLSTSRAVPFWDTPLLPVLFFGYAVLGAAGVVLLASSFLEDGLYSIGILAGGLIVANFALVLTYLLVMNRAGGSARESVRLLNRAPLNWAFLGGAVVVGMILPLAAIIWIPSALVPAGAGILIGGLLFRYCVLKAGVYVPPALISEDMDFSRLNRTAGNLEVEYAGMAAHGAGDRG